MSSACIWIDSRLSDHCCLDTSMDPEHSRKFRYPKDLQHEVKSWSSWGQTSLTAMRRPVSSSRAQKTWPYAPHPRNLPRRQCTGGRGGDVAVGHGVRLLARPEHILLLRMAEAGADGVTGVEGGTRACEAEAE